MKTKINKKQAGHAQISGTGVLKGEKRKLDKSSIRRDNGWEFS